MIEVFMNIIFYGGVTAILIVWGLIMYHIALEIIVPTSYEALCPYHDVCRYNNCCEDIECKYLLQKRRAEPA